MVGVWARNRALRGLAVIGLATGVLLVTVGGVVVEWPDIVSGGTLEVSVGALLIVPLAIAHVVSRDRCDGLAECHGARPVWLLDIAASLVIALWLIAIAGVQGTNQGAWLGVRNYLLLTGFGLILHTVTWRPIVTILPPLWALMSCVAGSSGPGLQRWAIPVWDSEPWTWCIGGALFAAGWVLIAIRRPPLIRTRGTAV